MPRLLFEKKGNAIWISHLDLMRMFQRAFKRAGLPLTHTQGFNPRPSVSIALPLSVGMESRCELLDFELYGDPVPAGEIMDRLNAALVEGIRVLSVYEDMQKIRNIAYLDCGIVLEYDAGIPNDCQDQILSLFAQPEVIMEKRSKNGIRDENIIPMIRKFSVASLDGHTLHIAARICCQNPALNPMQIPAAIEKYLPDIKPDFYKCIRYEIYDTEEKIFR